MINSINLNLNQSNTVVSGGFDHLVLTGPSQEGTTLMYSNDIKFDFYRPSGQRILLSTNSSATGATSFIFTNVTGFDIYDIEYSNVAPQPSYSTFEILFSADNGVTWLTGTSYLNNGLTRTSITVNLNTNLSGATPASNYYGFYGPAILDNAGGNDWKPENFPGECMFGYTRFWNLSYASTKFMQTRTTLRLVNQSLNTGYWGYYSGDGYWNGGTNVVNAIKVFYPSRFIVGTVNLYGIKL